MKCYNNYKKPIDNNGQLFTTGREVGITDNDKEADMRWICAFFCLPALILTPAFAVARADKAPVDLYMEDGQLHSRPVRVYVPDRNITIAMKPKLRLARVGGASAGRHYSPFQVAGNQQWEQDCKGTKVAKTGSLLLFDLSEYPIPLYCTGIRVLPILSWHNSDRPDWNETGKTGEIGAVAKRAVYLSNGCGTLLLTFLIVMAFLVFVYFMTKHREMKPLGLLSTADGRMSASLTQMALWTVVVGAAVLAFGLMRLDVPDIPDTLVWLMGLSATTSAAGHWQAHRLQHEKEKRDRAAGVKKTGQMKPQEPDVSKKGVEAGSLEKGCGKTEKPKIRHLMTICVHDNEYPSLPKAQVLFWTFITLVLFVVKSCLEGELWDVPEEMVVLMGISQTSFLGRKEMAMHEEKQRSLEDENQRLTEGTRR
jgi:hypothetical protein